MKLKAVASGILVTSVLAFAATVAGAQQLNGAGATFPYPIYSRWFSEYSQLHPNVRINYQPIGSGGGIRQVSDGVVDFGASDGPMSDQQMAAAKVKVMHIPTVLGAVVPVYNIPGVNKNLNFSGDVIADIYLGTISKWNDSRITKENPGVNLPDKAILPVYRSDGSGTTNIFTSYLSKVSTAWSTSAGWGKAVSWPVGVGGKGNEGVAGLVKQISGAIGYVELAYCNQNKMAVAKLKNKAGNYVAPSIESTTAAAEGALKRMPEDYKIMITNAAGENAYPISGFSWIVVRVNQDDAVKGKALVDLLNWVLATGNSEVSDLYYAPLPDSLIDKVKASVATIKY